MSTDDRGLAEAIRAAGVGADYDEPVDVVPYDFRVEVTRRDFLAVLGAGLMIAVTVEPAKGRQVPAGNRRGGGFTGRGAVNVAARVHVGADGVLTVMTGKVECGQGTRAELTQASAEELRVGVDRVRLVMADTDLVPDDGGTYGSLTTPATVPAVRRGCAAARDLLVGFAAREFGIDPKAVEFRDGRAGAPGSAPTVGYENLATNRESARAFASAVSAEVRLMPVEKWEILGKPSPRPNGRDVVRGTHKYPSDIARPGMLHGKVLRPPSYGAKLVSIDLAPAREMDGVVAVRDGEFVGVAAPSTWLARQAIDALADSARWEPRPHPSSVELYDHLRRRARDQPPANPFGDELGRAAKTVRRSYHVAYVQHVPMEPRAAVAEWEAGKLTAWTGTQVPFGVKNELARAFGLADDKVRVVVPDFGGGFGGKHSGECAVEAARLAKAAGKPVRLVWTRAEEFTWAQFRPAAVIDAEASLDATGTLTSWNFINLNSGAAEVQTPYRVAKNQCRYVACDPPLRHGSYRGLAATANNFARESFMDELAEAAGRDPLEFRLAHLDNPRIRAVLEEVARRFGWAERSKAKGTAGIGVGLASGTDKGGFVAACVEVAVDREKGEIAVRRVCQAYECGKILNPTNLMAQVKGAIIMGLGPALREAMEFEGGKITNASFSRYKVPRFADVPELEIHLLDRPDLASAGAGETPLIAVAPAIANAVRAATGLRVREMPIRLPASKKTEAGPDA